MKIKGVFTRVAAIVLVATMIPFVSTNVEAATKPKNPKVSGGVVKKNVKVVYDCITFGNYWQEDTNGDGVADKDDKKTPIKWRVLSVKGNDAFIVADQILDVQAFSKGNVEARWYDSTIRKWCNNKFMSNAFSSKEKKAIKTTKLINKSYLSTNYEGGKNTSDKIFFLSAADLANKKYGFTSFRIENGRYRSDEVGNIGSYRIEDFAKLRVPTDFAKGLGFEEGTANTESEYACKLSGINTGKWWSRSPGANSGNWTIFDYEGGHSYMEGVTNYRGIGVCPAMHIDLSSKTWKNAGKVTIKAGEYETISEAIVYSE